MINIYLYVFVSILVFLSYLKNKDKTKAAMKISLNSFENIMPQFLSIIIIVGFFLSILNPETISSVMGTSSGFIGILFSAVIGSIAIMPTFVAFSTGNILLKGGAGYAQVGALISSLTLIGIMTFSLEAKFIGKKAAFLRNLFAFFFSLIVAYFLEKVMILT